MISPSQLSRQPSVDAVAPMDTTPPRHDQALYAGYRVTLDHGQSPLKTKAAYREPLKTKRAGTAFKKKTKAKVLDKHIKSLGEHNMATTNPYGFASLLAKSLNPLAQRGLPDPAMDDLCQLILTKGSVSTL